jgi:hypothetical protein
VGHFVAQHRPDLVLEAQEGAAQVDRDDPVEVVV